MTALVLQLTDAGLAAIQGASGTDPTIVTELGITDTPFDFAPTLSALPGEFKRLPIASGVAAAANVAHLTVYDTSDDVWTATGFGLFLDDGTLLAAYTQDDAVLSKAGLAFAMLAFDIRFAGDLAASFEYGDMIFVWPPATEMTRGIAKLATQAAVDATDDEAGDDETIVTPRTLRRRLVQLAQMLDLSEELEEEAQARSDADEALKCSGIFLAKGHLDIPALGQIFRINWGKTDVAGKTATTDTYEAPYAQCFGVFQGGGTNNVNSTEALRAYPGTGNQALTHVNLTNGTTGLLTIHWIAIGLAPNS